MKKIQFLNMLGRNKLSNEKIVVTQEPEKKTFVGEIKYIPSEPNPTKMVIIDRVAMLEQKVKDLDEIVKFLQLQQAQGTEKK